MSTTHVLRPLAPRSVFFRHLGQGLALAALLVGVSLAIGACGYHYFEGLPWLDSTLNAAMILTGMGPVDHLEKPGAKLFATFYALFAGLVFLSTAALVLAPVVRRTLHKMHLDMHEERAG